MPENNNVDLQIALKEIEFRYSKGHKFEKGDLHLDRKLDLTSNKLAFQIVKHRRNQENKINSNEDRDFVASQLKALTLFKEIMTVSSEVDDFIAATRFTAANAVGSTQGALFAQQLKVKNYLEAIHDTESKRELTIAINDNFTGNQMIAPIDNSLELLSMEDQNYIERLIDNPLAYEQAMFDVNRKFLELLKKSYPFLTPLYTEVRDRFIELSKYGNLNEQTINDIHRDLMVYILSNKQGSEFYRNDFHLITSEQANLLSKEEKKEFVSLDGDDLIVTNEVYYKKIFPKSLFNTLEDYPELKKFAVF